MINRVAALDLALFLVAGLIATMAYGLPGLWLNLLGISLFAFLSGLARIDPAQLLTILLLGTGAGFLSILVQWSIERRLGRRGQTLNIFMLAGLLVGLILGAALRPVAGLLGGGALAGLPVWRLGKRLGFYKLPLFYAGALTRLLGALITAWMAWTAAFS